MNVSPHPRPSRFFLPAILFPTLLFADTAVDPENWHRFEIEGHEAFVILPEKAVVRPDKPTPWVLYAPTFHQSLPNPRDEGWMIERFLAKGIAVAGVDVGESYGSPDGRKTYDSLHSHLVKERNFDAKACLLARSRGGLMHYAWAADHPDKVRCIAGIYPVCDLASYPGLDKAAPAFKTDAAGLSESLSKHNPVHPDRLKPLSEHRVPIYHIHGDVDTVVPHKDNSLTLTENLRALGGSATLTIAPGQGHNMWRGFFEHQPLVDFIIGNATAPHLDPKPKLLWSGGAFTEGPVAAPDGTLLFSDVGADTIFRYDPASNKTTPFRGPSGRANGLAFDPEGNLIACEGANTGGNRRISTSTYPDEPPKTLADSWGGKRFNSPNDLALDAAGNVYFTDPRYVGDEPRELDFEGVFRVTPEGKVTLATRETKKPNGILISHDATTAYVADHESAPEGKRQLLAFDILPEGTFAKRRVLHDFGASRGIDGMALSPGGMIFAAAGAGDEAGIYIFNPAGALLNILKLPGDPTNCTFGRGENAGILYVTAQAPKSEGSETRPYALYQFDLR